MTHSFRANYFHLVWSTKNREALITSEVKAPLYAYRGGIIKNHQGRLLTVGGTSDHLHLLVGLNLPDQFSNFMRHIKASSSAWLNNDLFRQKNFGWQEGYASFSVSYSSLERVQFYIKHQEEHHKTLTFDEEYLQLLKKHRIKFDPRFVLG